MAEKHLLLFRGEQHPYERLDDYFDRIALNNGFLSRASFKNFLKEEIPKPVTKNHGFVHGRTLLYRRLEDVLKKRLQGNFADHCQLPTSRKICPACYANNKVILYYWHFTDYQVCHLCNLKMVAFPNKKFSLNYSNYPHEIGTPNWMSVAAYKSFVLADSNQIFYGNISLKKELDFFCLDIILFFSNYQDLPVECSDFLNKVISDAVFWEYKISEKYEALMSIISALIDVDKKIIKSIAFLSVLQIGGIRNYGTYRISVVSCDESINWAAEIMREFDWSRPPYVNIDGRDSGSDESIKNYSRDFDWLSDVDGVRLFRIFSKICEKYWGSTKAFLRFLNDS